MKKSYLFSLILGLGGLMAVGFSLGFYLHLSTSLRRFAEETDRTSGDYDYSIVWVKPPGEDAHGYPVILAKPQVKRPAPMQVQTRWHWAVANPKQPCWPDDHCLIWRFRKDAWEMLDDLEKDTSVPLFPDDAKE